MSWKIIIVKNLWVAAPFRPGDYKTKNVIIKKETVKIRRHTLITS